MRSVTLTLLVCFAGMAILPAPTEGAHAGRFDREFLEAHNRERAEVGLPPLTWSNKLAAEAERWARKLVAEKVFRHSPDLPFGENLFEIEGAPASPEFVVRSWASEARDYDYRTNRCRGVCGHYTQIVWRNTRQVGCAVARDRRREVWVCEYDPPGNYVGEKPY